MAGKHRNRAFDAAAELALVYSRRIDGGAQLHNLGGQFLRLLNELGLTPKARHEVRSGDPQPPAGMNALERLREDWHARRSEFH